MLAQPQQPDQPGLLGGDPEPLEGGPLGQHVGMVRQVGVRLAVPGGQGLVELLDEGRGLSRSGQPRRVAVAELAGERCEAPLGGATSAANRCTSTAWRSMSSR